VSPWLSVVDDHNIRIDLSSNHPAARRVVTGALTIVPVLQSAALEFVGSPLLGEPRWLWAGLRPGPVFPMQLGFLLLGALGSIALSLRISERDYPARARLAAAPWVALVIGLSVLAVWILVQPMEMRGVSFSG
jgi:hypothetical protein